MIALITINGIAAIGDKPKSLMVVEYTEEERLIHFLKNLQIGYSVASRDLPKIRRLEMPSERYPGKMRKVIDCYSQADWHHVAHLNVSSSSPSIPKETI